MGLNHWIIPPTLIFSWTMLFETLLTPFPCSLPSLLTLCTAVFCCCCCIFRSRSRRVPAPREDRRRTGSPDFLSRGSISTSPKTWGMRPEESWCVNNAERGKPLHGEKRLHSLLIDEESVNYARRNLAEIDKNNIGLKILYRLYTWSWKGKWTKRCD